MSKQPPPEPLVARHVRAIWRLRGYLTWPWQARQLKREGFRRTGWMQWESGVLMGITWGEIAYNAYVKSCGGKSIRGEDLPAWEDQDPAIREHWEAAGLAVREG